LFEKSILVSFFCSRVQSNDTYPDVSVPICEKGTGSFNMYEGA